MRITESGNLPVKHLFEDSQKRANDSGRPHEKGQGYEVNEKQIQPGHLDRRNCLLPGWYRIYLQTKSTTSGSCPSLLHRGHFVLWEGLEERKRERAGHDYCYVYRDTQREPLRRREGSCTKSSCPEKVI